MLLCPFDPDVFRRYNEPEVIDFLRQLGSYLPVRIRTLPRDLGHPALQDPMIVMRGAEEGACIQGRSKKDQTKDNLSARISPPRPEKSSETRTVQSTRFAMRFHLTFFRSLALESQDQ